MEATPHDVAWGANPRTKTCYGDGTFPRHEDRIKLIPRELWKPVSLRRHVDHIFSQLDGMCTANGAVMTLEIERSFRGAAHNPELSPEYLYGQVAQWGEGSGLDEILKSLAENGCCTRQEVPRIDGHLHRSWPENHEDLAGANRMLEWVDLNASFDAVATALQLHKPCLVGVRWPGGGGHAICVTELFSYPAAQLTADPTWCIGGPNSWGSAWGDDGFYTLTERQCGDFSQFGCWAAGTST